MGISQQYRVGWNDTMEAFRDLQSRDEETRDYITRIEAIADTRLTEPGLSSALKQYFRGILGAVIAFRRESVVQRLEK